MQNLRLVILDYPLLQKGNPLVKRLLNDIIFGKQENFERTDPNYIVLDKHDMIGTHFLIFEVTNIYEPKLIYGARTTFESRAKTHKIKTPIQEIKLHFGSDAQLVLNEFISQHGELIEVNSLFVAPDYSTRSTGLHLSDIGFSMIALHLARMGHGHFAGCPNEKYKAHRLVENTCNVKNNRGYNFVHPVVQDPHQLLLIESFKTENIVSMIGRHLTLFNSLLEVSPAKQSYSSIQDTINYWLQTPQLKKAD